MKKHKRLLPYALSCFIAGAIITTASAFAQVDATVANTGTEAVSPVVVTVPTPAKTIAVTPASAIAYPIAELGNCASKDECHVFCENTENIQACTDFGQKKGITGAAQAARAKTFAAKIKDGKGPGGCSSPSTCNQYCSNVQNMDECVAFAEKNGLKGANYEEGKKIQSFLKTGGTTPGNCQSNSECVQYCGQFAHAEECADFAQKAGLGQKKGEGKTVDNTQAAKLTALVQSGATPGGCSSKDECEKYCSDPIHRSECVDFGVRLGFVKAGESEQLKQARPQGPGGCSSSESCQAFCTDPSNKETCLRFAKEHGITSVMNALERTVRGESPKTAGNSLSSFPTAAVECIKASAPEAVSLLETGNTQAITTEMKQKISNCVSISKPGEGNKEPQKIEGRAVNAFSPSVLACIKTNSPDAYALLQSKDTQSLTTEMKTQISTCLKTNQPAVQARPVSTTGTQSNLSPVVLQCYSKVTGSSVVTNVNLDQMSAERRAQFKECVAKTAPIQGKPAEIKTPQVRPMPAVLPGNNVPIAIRQCYKQVTGSSDATIISTEKMSPEVMSKFKECVARMNPTQNRPTVEEGSTQTDRVVVPMPASLPPTNTIPTADSSIPSAPPIESQPAVLPDASQSVNYTARFMALALMPISWIFGH